MMQYYKGIIHLSGAHIDNRWSHYRQRPGRFLALTGAKVGTSGALGWQYLFTRCLGQPIDD